MAAITILVPLGVLTSSAAGQFSLFGDSSASGGLQDAGAESSQTPARMPANQNAMETLKQLYSEQAFAEISRCSGTEDGSMCTETMRMLITTCDDPDVERIAACDDPRLQSYRNRA